MLVPMAPTTSAPSTPAPTSPTPAPIPTPSVLVPTAPTTPAPSTPVSRSPTPASMPAPSTVVPTSPTTPAPSTPASAPPIPPIVPSMSNLSEISFLEVTEPAEIEKLTAEIANGVLPNAQGRYACPLKDCSQWCKSRGDLRRHLQTKMHMSPSYKCRQCGAVFTRDDALKRHMRTCTTRHR